MPGQGFVATIRRIAGFTVVTAAGLSAAGSAYLGLLTALSLGRRTGPTGDRRRFAVVVPAHDEAATIGPTLASLYDLDYPRADFEVFVVADNCSDETASVAQEAGATVLERSNPEQRGKGHALAFAYDVILGAGVADAVVIIDADTLVSSNLLRSISGRLERGAAVLQADYRVRNPGSTWRTRLLDVAFTCNHLIRSQGRMRLGLSAGLRGNGMACAADVLRRVPHRAYSAVEDLEYGIDLGLAGVRVEFVPDAFVAGDMPPGGAASKTQRTRWEVGRSEIRRRRTPRLIWSAAVRRDVVLADLAIDLIAPPIATMALGLAGAGVAARVFPELPGRRVTVRLVEVGFASLLAHVLTGVARSPSGWRALPALFWAPVYAGWKVWLATTSGWRSQRRGGALWTRTARSSAAVDSPSASSP